MKNLLALRVGSRRSAVPAPLIAIALFVPAVSAQQPCLPHWDAAIGTPGLRPAAGSTFAEAAASAVFNDGAGAALYVGGHFVTAGGVPARNIARWNGLSWAALPGGGLNEEPLEFAVFDDGNGHALYAGGFFTGSEKGAPLNFIGKWDGRSWSPLGAGLNGIVAALTVFDDGTGPALYAGGLFTAAGGSQANAIAKWDGAEWSALGTGLFSTQGNTRVLDLIVFDDGNGPALYAGGIFDFAGNQPANFIARWDGTSWSPLGAGLNSRAVALGVFDDGSGDALFAGGNFTQAGGISAQGIAKWNGAGWFNIGSANGPVESIATFHDGAGEALFAGGSFDVIGATPANFIARWDGATWSPLGGGVLGIPFAMTVFSGGANPALAVGGNISSAGGAPVGEISLWSGCGRASDLNQDGDVNGVDLAFLLAQWGECESPGGYCNADLNLDGIINGVDLASLLSAWGSASGG